MVNTVLSVDIGTSSLKAGLITADGEDVFICKQKYSNPANRYIAQRWFSCLQKAVQKINEEYAEGLLKTKSGKDISVIAISISGNGPTLVSESGLTYKWNEPVEEKVLNNISDEGKKSLFVPRLLTFKEKYKDDWEKSKLIFSGPEYLIYQLTSKAITILPEARYTSAYWTDKVLEDNGIESSKLPPFMTVGQEYGKLSAEAAAELNRVEVIPGGEALQKVEKINKAVSRHPLIKEGLPVFGAGPDFIAALIGTGTTKAGELCDRSGSSEGINFCVDKPVFAEKIRTLPSVVPGLWNISFLIPESSKLSEDKRLSAVKEGIDLLKALSEKNGIEFPECMRVTGGQTADRKFIQRKANILGLKLIINHCKHSELLGDAKVVWKNYENL